MMNKILISFSTNVCQSSLPKMPLILELESLKIFLEQNHCLRCLMFPRQFLNQGKISKRNICNLMSKKLDVYLPGLRILYFPSFVRSTTVDPARPDGSTPPLYTYAQCSQRFSKSLISTLLGCPLRFALVRASALPEPRAIALMKLQLGTRTPMLSSPGFKDFSRILDSPA